MGLEWLGEACQTSVETQPLGYLHQRGTFLTTRLCSNTAWRDPDRGTSRSRSPPPIRWLLIALPVSSTHVARCCKSFLDVPSWENCGWGRRQYSLLWWTSINFLQNKLLEMGNGLTSHWNKLEMTSLAASPKQPPAGQYNTNGGLGWLVMGISLLFAYFTLN